MQKEPRTEFRNSIEKQAIKKISKLNYLKRDVKEEELPAQTSVGRGARTEANLKFKY